MHVSLEFKLSEMFNVALRSVHTQLDLDVLKLGPFLKMNIKV